MFDDEKVIYRMTIRKNGRTIRRSNGKPFRIVLRSCKRPPNRKK